ncbi:hypothetical protein GCM10009849_03420 [Sinomonas flava]|uniref:Uncharacterized protein n=1 Tax=Sinomonas flava TaxID=496857 RepID=A0ABN3BJZ1_9MICC
MHKSVPAASRGVRVLFYPGFTPADSAGGGLPASTVWARPPCARRDLAVRVSLG